MGENDGRCIHCVYKRIECSATCAYKSVFPMKLGKRGAEAFLTLYKCYKKSFLKEGLTRFDSHENSEVYKREFINGLIYACETRKEDPNGGAAALYWKIRQEINRIGKLYDRLMAGYPVQPTHREARRSATGLELEEAGRQRAADASASKTKADGPGDAATLKRKADGPDDAATLKRKVVSSDGLDDAVKIKRKDSNIWQSITYQFDPVSIICHQDLLHVLEVYVTDGMEVQKGQHLFSVNAYDTKEDGTSLKNLKPFCIDPSLICELFYNDNHLLGLVENRNRMALIGTGTDQYRAEQLKIKEKIVPGFLDELILKKREAEQPCQTEIITAHKSYRLTKVHVIPGMRVSRNSNLFSFESVLKEGGIRLRFDDRVYSRFNSSFEKYPSVYHWHSSTMNKIWNSQDQSGFDVRECWRNIKEFDCFDDIPLPLHILSVERTSNQKTAPSEKGTPSKSAFLISRMADEGCFPCSEKKTTCHPDCIFRPVFSKSQGSEAEAKYKMLFKHFKSKQIKEGLMKCPNQVERDLFIGNLVFEYQCNVKNHNGVLAVLKPQLEELEEMAKDLDDADNEIRRT